MHRSIRTDVENAEGDREQQVFEFAEASSFVKLLTDSQVEFKSFFK